MVLISWLGALAFARPRSSGRGARVIDPLSLAGIRPAARQPNRDALRIAGPFRLVRHPIYLR